MLRATSPVDDLEKVKRVPMPPKSKAVVSIQIRDNRRGESLTLTLHRTPWKNQFICEHGQFSASHLGRSIGLMLLEA